MAAAVAARPYGIATGAYVAERNDWAAAIGRARSEQWRWLELTAMRGRLAPLLRFLDDGAGVLASFERVSVHAPAAMTETAAEAIASLEPLDFDVVLHPDVYGSEPACARIGRPPGVVFRALRNADARMDIAACWRSDWESPLIEPFLACARASLRQAV